MRVEYQQEHIQISLASISKALIINHVRINNNYSYITVYHILSVYRYLFCMNVYSKIEF